jgi:magnesium transporter
MVKIEVCMDGNGAFTTVPIEQLPSFLEPDNAFAWIDVDANNPEELAGLEREFGLPHLAVESSLSRGQRPKITLYDDLIYLEFYGLRSEGNDFAADDIGIFIGDKYVVTVRRDNRPSLESLQARWAEQQQHPATQGNRNTGPKSPKHVRPDSAMLLYAILDELVDGYFPVVEHIGEVIEDLEDRIMGNNQRHPNVEIQHQRTRLLALRRLLSPEQEVLNTLVRRDVPIFDEKSVPYFADVHDHILRIYDWIESYRDQLSTVVDLQLSMQSQRLDRTIRTLTNWSIILMSCSLVAGIYGMNFDRMPELGWRLGYPMALGLMLLVGVSISLILRRIRWW